MALRRRKNKVPHPPAMCPLTECTKLVGGAWTPNVIWYLSGGARRFGELRADIPQISAKVLTARLRTLEGKGVVIRLAVATSPPSVEYALSELGQELVPLIQAMVLLGEKLKGVTWASTTTPAHASNTSAFAKKRLPALA